jgi:long-chain acyl-CoA synthetase
MQGYWRRQEETERALRGGWLHTGDLAVMDSDGFFRIIDRISDLIPVGSRYVYPRDVEEVLFRHPAVKEAAVVGIPDEYRGETVRAFVILGEETSATEEEIIAFCREHLASYKAPSSVRFRTELPKSTVGKVLRRELAREPDDPG